MEKIHKPSPGHELVRPSVPLRTTGPLSASEVDDYYRDGVIVKRGLVSGEKLASVLKAREDLSKLPAAISGLYQKLNFNMWDQSEAFRVLATTTFAAAAAQLTPATASTGGRELVALRDAYFVMQGSSKGCYFHVDDAFFWPSPRDAPGPGVNVWLALDEISAEIGGGLAVARGSHTAEYLDCREAISGGFMNTCQLAEIAPEKAKRLERIAVIPEMQPGDAIIHTRYLFHRAEPFKEGTLGYSGETGIGRYSVRYMPGTAVVEPVAIEGKKVVFGEKVRLADADPTKYPSCILSEE